MHLKYMVHKPNIFTIWYIKCNSIFHIIGMGTYPRKYIQWRCLPEGHINWNKGQIYLFKIGSPLIFFL